MRHPQQPGLRPIPLGWSGQLHLVFLYETPAPRSSCSGGEPPIKRFERRLELAREGVVHRSYVIEPRPVGTPGRWVLGPAVAANRPPVGELADGRASQD